MEKRLLLLGLLRHEEMHGYQLNEMLPQDNGLALIPFSKANAYKLLKKMEMDGWVIHHKEQEGNRPPRRVYRITADGEEAFQKVLRNQVAAYPPSIFPHVVSLDFIRQLPADEAINLLQIRRNKILGLQKNINDVPKEIRKEHLSLDYLHQHYCQTSLVG